MGDAGPDINGFMVVRKPAHALGPNSHRLEDYRLNDKTYHGRDRLPWEDLDDDHYAGTLSEELSGIRALIRQENRDFSGVDITRDYHAAVKVHAAWADRSDLIAVWSPDLVPVKGRTTSPVPLEWLGYDCIASGEFSLLLDGVYFKPEHFPDSVRALNAFGLFDSPDDGKALFKRYVALSQEEIVEPLSNTPKLISLEIYAVAL